MKRKRIIETLNGIQSDSTTTEFNEMQRNMRNRGFLCTDEIIKSGISEGHAVEIGPGPGYLGLEWLKKTESTKLTGLEISNSMIFHAEKNSREYKLSERASYIQGNALSIPFEDNSFDAAFSSGSMHEWENPLTVFNEIHRILKPGGKVYISDLKRNLNLLITAIFYFSVKGQSMKKGLLSSVKASYTRNELVRLCEWSLFNNFSVKENPAGISITVWKDV